MLGGFLGLAIATFAANAVSGLIAVLIVRRHPLEDVDGKDADGNDYSERE